MKNWLLIAQFWALFLRISGNGEEYLSLEEFDKSFIMKQHDYLKNCVSQLENKTFADSTNREFDLDMNWESKTYWAITMANVLLDNLTNRLNKTLVEQMGKDLQWVMQQGDHPDDSRTKWHFYFNSQYPHSEAALLWEWRQLVNKIVLLKYKFENRDEIYLKWKPSARVIMTPVIHPSATDVLFKPN